MQSNTALVMAKGIGNLIWKVNEIGVSFKLIARTDAM